MNTPSNSVAETPSHSQIIAPASTRPMLWSVRRELWENHSIWIAPLIVAGIILFGTIVSASHLPARRHNAMLLDPVHRQAAIEMPYDIAAVMIIFTVLVVGVFYCLDALHGERRERSILFWKSLPVSDLTTVVSKVIIALVVLPLVSFTVIVATQFIMMLISTVALLSSGLAATTWANFPLIRQSLVLLYGLAAIALWHAPIYGWALLISGWARRGTFLWAVLPLLAIGFFEKITFNSSHFASMMKDRFTGFAPEAFAFHAHSLGSVTLTPEQYLASPGLWIGLACAVGFVAAAIRMRRYSGPL